MIKLQNISKSFGDHKVLKNISAHINPGEKVVLVGPSGSGKSTLLRIMNMLETPNEGAVYVNNICITNDKKNRRSALLRVGMVFQHFNLFPHMNVIENITYAPRHVQGISKTIANEKGIDLLMKVGLVDKALSYPANLSGGQKQRVAIARCLAMDPEILLFDEPTSALDPEMVHEVMDVISGLSQTNITMVVVTHEMAFARDMATRVLFMDQGVIVEDGLPKEFFKSPKTERAQLFLKCISEHS